jgi:hypothetical protein
VLQTGGGLRQLLDLGNEELPKGAIAPAVMQSNLEIPLPNAPLWDEVAVAVKERLQVLVAETEG